MKFLTKLPNGLRYIFYLAVACIILWWVTSLIGLRNDAIELKDTASVNLLDTAKADLKRSQAQVKRLESTILEKDKTINRLTANQNELATIRSDMETKIAIISIERDTAEGELERYKLNYSQEAMKDVEAVEDFTNTTISDIMREHEAITSRAGGN